MQNRIETEDKDNKSILDQTFFSPPKACKESTQQSFTLDLKAIIKEKANSEWHARVGAYDDQKFQELSETKIGVTDIRIPFKPYFTSIIEVINEIERIKYRLMKNMIDIISEVYGTVAISPVQHNEFCKELLFQIDIAMSTCADSFYSKHIHIGRITNELPVFIISQFWTSLLSRFTLEDDKAKAYTVQLNQLVTWFEKAFLAKEKSDQIFKHYSSSGITTNPCAPWNFIASLCNANDLDEQKLEVFKQDYQKTCFGLASEFVYLPDMWEFLRNANSQLINTSKETLNDLDKILKKQTGLKVFKPQEQNILDIGMSKMGLK